MIRYLLLLLFVTPLPLHAGLSGQLDSAWSSLNEMSNTTGPSSFQTATRGGFTHGSYVRKNKIMDVNLLSITPPSFEAGCGGVDFFGGSFSFISGDQLTELFRSIASNAEGLLASYGFKVAMSAMCEDCEQHMETLQKKIQQMNQYFGNSCQLAEGILTDTVPGYQKTMQSKSSFVATAKGSSDIFQSWTAETGKNPDQLAEEIPASDLPPCALKGNLVWCALVNNSASSWFDEGDTDFLEAIMSLTGSIIVGDLADDAMGEGKSRQVAYVEPTNLSIAALVEGGTVDLWECGIDTGADGCRNPSIHTNVSINGLAQRARETLLGTSSATGLIEKFATNTGTPTDEEKALLTNLPGGVGGMLRTLSALDRNAAEQFALQAAPLMGLEMASVIVTDMVKAARLASQGDDSAYAAKLHERLSAALSDLQKEKSLLTAKYGGFPELLAIYDTMLRAIRSKKYLQASNS